MNHLVDDLTEEITTEKHVEQVAKLVQALLPFHAAREDTYQMSFAKRGEIGVWMNLARKYDRMDNLARDTFDGKGASPGVSLVDTLVDLAMYSLKWLAIVKHVRPDDLELWIERVYCHDTGMGMQEALKLFGVHWSQNTVDVQKDTARDVLQSTAEEMLSSSPIEEYTKGTDEYAVIEDVLYHMFSKQAKEEAQ